jgi:hypothetical protein
VTRIRATSLAGEVERAVGVVGMAVVPSDELGGRMAARQILAGYVEPAVTRSAYCVDHGVVVPQQFLVGDVLADCHVEVAMHVSFAHCRTELIGDTLRARMIGGDTGAHQPVRGGQALEHVDLHARFGGQFHRGVTGRGTGPDDRDVQRAERGVDRRQLHRIRPVGTDGVFGVVLRIDVEVGGVDFFEVVLGIDGLDRAFLDAGTAVDAGVGVDVQHFRGRERFLVRCGMDAVDRTDIDARGVVAARLRNHISHGSPLPEYTQSDVDWKPRL